MIDPRNYGAISLTTGTEVKAMIRKEKEKASVASVFSDFKHPYSVEVAAKLNPVGYQCQSFNDLMVRRQDKGACRALLRFNGPIF